MRTTTENTQDEQQEKDLNWAVSLAVGTPTADGKMPRTRPRAKWTQLGLDIFGDATIEDLTSWVRVLHEARESGEIALADIIAYARKNNMVDELEKVFEDLGFDMPTIKRALAIAEVPAALRAKQLNAEHYFVVSGLLYEEQMKWLKAALDHNLTGFELKRSIEMGRVMTRQELMELNGSGSGGIKNYQGILTQWNRWKTKIGGEDAVLSWPSHVLESFVEERHPVVELVSQAEAKLKEGK
jgi:hypothetical protein